MADLTLAQLDDLEARMGHVGDVARASAALDDASAVIHAETDDAWVGDDGELVESIPSIVVTVCCKVASRVLENPEGLTSETLGPFSAGRANPSPDAYLTKNERRLILRAAGKSGGIGSIELESPFTSALSTLYAPQYGGGDPIPMIALP